MQSLGILGRLFFMIFCFDLWESLSKVSLKDVLVMNREKKTKSPKLLALFILGGAAYYLIEILYRGHSHWTMAVCGGICLVGIDFINERMARRSYFLRAAFCSLLITAIEFITGCVVNLWLDWNVWSYSALSYNLLGQISLLFSCYWFVLSYGVCLIISHVEKRRSQKQKELSETTPL